MFKFEIRFHPSKPIFRELVQTTQNKLSADRGQTSRSGGLWPWLLVALVLGGFISTQNFRSLQNFWLSIGGPGWGFFAGMIISIVVLTFVLQMIGSRMAVNSLTHSRMMQTEWSVALDGEGIRLMADGVTHSAKWQTVDWVANERISILVGYGGSAIPIPKSSLPPEVDPSELTGQIDARIKSSRD